METWQPIPGLAALVSASSLGRVRREPFLTRHGRLFTPVPTYGTKTHYMLFKFKVDYVQYQFHVHRLVCMAFHGLPDDEVSICIHKDNNRYNNRPENLAWATTQVNNEWNSLRIKAGILRSTRIQ